MDPLSALSLAVNLGQLLDYSLTFIDVAAKLARSPERIMEGMQEMEVAASDLKSSMNLVVAEPIDDQEETLTSISQASYALANEMLKSIEAVRGKMDSSRRKIILNTLRVLREEKRLNEMQSKLLHIRVQFNTHVAAQSLQYQAHVRTTLQSMGEKLDHLVQQSDTGRGIQETQACTNEYTFEIGDGREKPDVSSIAVLQQNISVLKITGTPPTQAEGETSSLAGHTIVQTSQASAQFTQMSLNIKAPSRFRCRNATCACACHLNRYLKRPIFLRRFFGAISFRGTCQNHDSNLWELKYWIPGWISNNNLYILFERNSCGSPSVGLKFQRRVPWGGQDTIIRFSFLGDAEGIRSILQKRLGSLDDVDPNHGRTALHYAVMKNNPELCKFLLQAGADPFIEDRSNMSATHKAWEHIWTKRGKPEVLDIFRTLFADNDLDYWRFSPLHQAVIGVGGLKTPELLSSAVYSSEINARDAHQQTALHWAAQRGDLCAVESLLDAGADVEVTDRLGCSPLLFAVSAAVPRIVELLILSGANVNATNNRGDSPLHFAARHKDDLNSVKILVRAGAVVDRKNSLGNTPFAGAAIENRVDVGKYLLKCGADRYNTNMYGDTPLRETVQHNRHAFLQMLLDDGTRYNDINKDGSSLLHTLALEGDTKTVQILSANGLKGLDVHLKNKRGKTAADICEKRIKAPEGFKDAFVKLIGTGL